MGVPDLEWLKRSFVPRAFGYARLMASHRNHELRVTSGSRELVPVSAAPSEPVLLQHLTDVLDFLQTAPRRHGNVPLYMRISKGELGDALEGPSWDCEAHVQLPGWSVSRVTPEPWWPRLPDDWVARRLAQYRPRLSAERCGWLVTGDEVGVGPDHEPLLVHLSYWAQVKPQAFEEAHEVYRARFDLQPAARHP